MSGSKLRVAVSGGGVAGASLIHALLQYPHIDANIFEAAPQFKEAGIAFGMSVNAQTALELIGPSARECLERAGGVQMQGIEFSVCQGKDTGVPVYQRDVKVQGKTTSIVQRADFLREFLAIIPDERMHASKRLERYERVQDGSLVLHFVDGTTHECDILIGADGIRSVVRKAILGSDDPAVNPRNTGWWALMTLQPYEKARASLGALVDKDDAREIGYFGDGQIYLHNILSHGTVVQFSMVSKDDAAENSDLWQKTVSADEVKKYFVHEDRPDRLNKAVVELLCEQPEQQAYYLFEHPPARTYVDGPVAVIGDAAHATTAWQASGGGMSIEDSMVLSTLLGRSKSQEDAILALKVFDQVRRPRCQKIVESSNGTGVIVTGQSEAGLDAAKLKQALEHRWDFIFLLDVPKHRDDALELFEAELKRIHR